MVIAVSPKGNHRAIGGAPSHSACGCEEADNNAPMISIPIEALSTDMEDGEQAMPEVGDDEVMILLFSYGFDVSFSHIFHFC